ncbi:hypothetical protein CEXT_615261 [Caerostris extrusa]|uniref:Uncharacterized protein n=1 Tax=Caerostris extrusa TaxID=172846 RepID=A0AAV4XU98_CAEEX|nr:hypothetical protein CEXT_615261 [Caerostris extrusa]
MLFKCSIKSSVEFPMGIGVPIGKNKCLEFRISGVSRLFGVCRFIILCVSFLPLAKSDDRKPKGFKPEACGTKGKSASQLAIRPREVQVSGVFNDRVKGISDVFIIHHNSNRYLIEYIRPNVRVSAFGDTLS